MRTRWGLRVSHRLQEAVSFLARYDAERMKIFAPSLKHKSGVTLHSDGQLSYM